MKKIKILTKSKDCPIFLVGTHLDDFYELDITQQEAINKSINEMLQLKFRHYNIASLSYVSCVTGIKVI